ncbi:efflux RND transporter periplasmic adaptor subunit [Salinisphaera aquimarina]|uniref:Efflux RND transporter periplasmic adaptor subunit n=1 Tax=Salinisphaera aquimarina TaxID=2094031 RepID=A0ABV7ELS4_9GAMM
MKHAFQDCRRWRGAGIAILVVATTVLCTSAHAQQRAKIEAIKGTVISSELSGRISSLPYREGDAFKKGAKIAEIDCALYRAERDRVSAKLQSARRTYENRQRLAELRSVGKLDVDLARLAVSESNAELRVASTNVSRCSLNAPFSGRVVRLYAREGQSVKAQEQLLEIVGQELEARIIVPARWLTWLDKGRKVSLVVEETGGTVTGSVTRIGAAVDPVSHTIPIWASLDESGPLRPGMTAAASFPDKPAAKSAE